MRSNICLLTSFCDRHKWDKNFTMGRVHKRFVNKNADIFQHVEKSDCPLPAREYVVLR